MTAFAEALAHARQAGAEVGIEGQDHEGEEEKETSQTERELQPGGGAGRAARFAARSRVVESLRALAA